MKDLVDIPDRLARGEHIRDVSTTRWEYRRIRASRLATVASRIRELESAPCNLVEDWHSVPPDRQVPDEINVNEHWDAARAALGINGDPREEPS